MVPENRFLCAIFSLIFVMSLTQVSFVLAQPPEQLPGESEKVPGTAQERFEKKMAAIKMMGAAYKPRPKPPPNANEEAGFSGTNAGRPPNGPPASGGVGRKPHHKKPKHVEESGPPGSGGPPPGEHRPGGGGDRRR